MKSWVRGAVVLAVAALGLGGVFGGGCATGNDRRDKQIAQLGGRPPEPAPPRGWSNYKPERRPYEPDPVRSAVAPAAAPQAGVGSDTN